MKEIMHSLCVPRNQINIIQDFIFWIKYFCFWTKSRLAKNLFRVAGGIRRLPALKYIPEKTIFLHNFMLKTIQIHKFKANFLSLRSNYQT